MPLFYSRATLVLALLVPVVALPTRNGSTVVSYSLALLALALFLTHGLKGVRSTAHSDIKLMAVIFFGPLVAMCLTSAYYGDWSGSEIEKNVRIALSLGTYWLLIQLPAASLKRVQWSLLIAAATGAFMFLAIMDWFDLGRGAITEFGAHYNAIALANLTLFFGFSSLLTLGWQLSSRPRLEMALKIGVALLSVYAVVISQTRSSWMLLPIFIFVVVLLSNRFSRSVRRACLIGGIAALLVAVVIVPQVNHRMAQIVTDVSSYEEGGQRNTSVGIRMQLWVASWYMAKENILLGAGGSEFREELQTLSERGIVTPFVAKNWGEPHSDIISAFASYGLLGLFAILALYLAPACVFLRRIRDPNNRIRVAASIGLLLCLGYTAFSLTEMMFRGMRSVTVYTIMLAIFMALTRQDTPAPSDPIKAPRV